MIEKSTEGIQAGIQQKAIVGFLILALRKVLLQAVYTVSNIFLARLLFPSDFGIYAIIGSIGAVFLVFSDIGLAAAMVQKRRNISSLEIKTSFTVQLILGIFIFLLINIFANFFAEFYKIETHVGLVRLYSIVFLLSSFRLIPLALLERNLKYLNLFFVEVIPMTLGLVVTVILAFLDFGISSFIWGVLVNYLISALILLPQQSWFKGVYFDIKSFLSLAKFGFNFQTNVFLGLLYGPLIILYLGKEVGSENLGYFQFAASIYVFPLAFAEIINRVSFPIGSRLQRDKVLLKNLVERTVSLISITTLPLVGIGLVAVKPFLHYIYTDRWLPALPVVYLGLLQMGIMSYTGFFSQILMAKGKSEIIRNIAVLWAFLTWIIAPFLIYNFNFVGLSITNFIVTISGIIFYFILKKYVDFSFWNNVLIYIIGSVFATVIFVILWSLYADSLLTLVISVGLSMFAYIVFLFLFAKETLVQYSMMIKGILKL
ncbi:MAG: Polysaccharide biosynthesis protein [Candidatus Curtissbacteria bacterium GW2011_GWA1_40_47]|uniref:Polysaccharide biosynthesis protein C-terminal domain-containing protein n=1 Tax=Candidatus Curtissbacteria bacterium RIFOXYA1_FULL_41_14 TaxID=1797737 RepID=A0A1F5HE06_9BACT|nr:MAG: Polysaccharide biosynthesis protein [Candidatus Curtissbacteria bacterium GW2011_GWB1_40_28]KKR60765.1 MAG: Undecaprenyl-diphospho-oligosaccharide flippase [Microgenomates group bacterium GW2011_GWC1_40_35]KKR64922.1 MAG: Polysaccharide biosynthesis protein [Candidatus Curtissbacteria bacterium GW2011_GWA1_40_47]KKR77783.1 MAG: Polysaccharide biosynthesis protein [Candidatus Curtissbacteria bacterium GW2011_GWD1_40_8]KKS00472.1 MAG: Polysaccharide biosynthesis protein [Candidatus Curtis